MILPVPSCSSQSTLSLWMFPQRLLARCSLCWMVAQHKISQNTSTIIKRAPKAAKLLLRLAPFWLQVSNLRSSVSQSTSLCCYAMLITSADSSFPMVSWLGSLRNLAVLTWVVLCWHSDPSLPDLCWVPRMMKNVWCRLKTCWPLAWPYLYWNNILRQCCWIVAAFHHRKVHLGDGKLMVFSHVSPVSGSCCVFGLIFPFLKRLQSLTNLMGGDLNRQRIKAPFP